MIRARTVSLASLLLLANACAGPSTEAVGAPSVGAPAGAATPSASSSSNEPRTTVVCEYVRRSGSNIMERQCREVTRFGDDSGKKGAEGWFRTPPGKPNQ